MKWSRQTQKKKTFIKKQSNANDLEGNQFYQLNQDIRCNTYCIGHTSSKDRRFQYVSSEEWTSNQEYEGDSKAPKATHGCEKGRSKYMMPSLRRLHPINEENVN